MADDVQSFEFKTALLSGRDNWTLDGGFLTRNGELFCSLDNVKRARFAQMTVRYSHSSWLDLHFGDRRQRITCNMHPGDDSHEAFLSLSAAILDELAARKPGMQVAFGAGGAIRWTMFLIGVAALVFGLGIFAAALMGGVGDDKRLFAMIFGGGFALFGAGLGWNYRPWAPPVTLSVDRARDVVAQLALDAEPQPAQDDGEQPEQDKG